MELYEDELYPILKFDQLNLFLAKFAQNIFPLEVVEIIAEFACYRCETCSTCRELTYETETDAHDFVFFRTPKEIAEGILLCDICNIFVLM